MGEARPQRASLRSLGNVQRYATYKDFQALIVKQRYH